MTQTLGKSSVFNTMMEMTMSYIGIKESLKDLLSCRRIIVQTLLGAEWIKEHGIQETTKRLERQK